MLAAQVSSLWHFISFAALLHSGDTVLGTSLLLNDFLWRLHREKRIQNLEGSFQQLCGKSWEDPCHPLLTLSKVSLEITKPLGLKGTWRSQPKFCVCPTRKQSRGCLTYTGSRPVNDRPTGGPWSLTASSSLSPSP